MSRAESLARERRLMPWAAGAALLAPPLVIGSLVGAAQLELPSTGVATEQVRAFEANSGELLVAVALRSLGFLLMAFPLGLLFVAARARNEQVPKAMVGFVAIGPVLFALQGILSWVAQSQISSDFVAAATSGGDVYSLLDGIADDSGLASASESMLLPALLGLGVAMVYFPLQAMRVGLLTRFFATLGMALGAALILFPGVALLPITIWFLWLGLVIIGRTPAGRPPAWDAGVAIPWPAPGEEARPAPAAATAGGEVVEGSGEEVGEEAVPRDHSARRERARKRKRKRRA